MYRPWYMYIAKGQALFPLILLLSVISGFDAALTDAIFHGQTEVLVTPGLVRREGLTLDTCASACVTEKTIKCQYFKFINSTRTCYLSETDHPNTKYLVNGPMKPHGSKTDSSSIRKLAGLEQSIDRLKNVQQNIENVAEKDDERASDMKTLKKQSVKEVKAIVTLDGRLRSLHSQVSDIAGDLLDLEKSQRTIAKNLQSVRSSTGNLGLNVKKLTQLAGELQSDVEDVKTFNSSILRQLGKVSHSTMDLDRKLNRLSTYVHDNKHPDELLNSQLRITKGMSAMARSQKSLRHQLRGLEQTVDKLTSTLGRESKGSGEAHQAVLNLQTSIDNIKTAMAKLSDPMSVQNRRWQGDIGSIKQILGKLAGTNTRLDEEMKGNKREVASVIKELTNVQMAVQSLKSNIDGVQSNNAELEESVQELMKTKSKSPSIVEMTKMSTTILKSLSAIDRKERTLKSKMQQLGESLAKLEKRWNAKALNAQIDRKELHRVYMRMNSYIKEFQKMSKFVAKMPRNQPLAGKIKRNENEHKKLVNTVNHHWGRVIDIDAKLKHFQVHLQRRINLSAEKIVKESSKKWRKAVKKLTSDLEKLRGEDRSNKGKLARLETAVRKLEKKGKIEPIIESCPMGTIQRGRFCFPAKMKSNKGKTEKKPSEEKKEKKPSRGKKGNKPSRGKKGKKPSRGKKVKKPSRGKKPSTVKKGKNKHHQGKKGEKKHLRKKHPIDMKAKMKHPILMKGKMKHHRNNGHKNNHKRRGKREVDGVDLQALRVEKEIGPNTKQPVAMASKKGPFCPPGYQLVDLYCFMYLPQPQTYDIARLQCKNHNGEVPEILSTEMQQALKLFLLAVTQAKVPSVWLSAMTYKHGANKWYWEGSGDTVLYENYMMDPPTGRDGEMCNQFRIEWDSHWSASLCNQDTKLPTVCHHHVDHIPPSKEKLPY